MSTPLDIHHHAAGLFDVTLSPQPWPEAQAAGLTFGRLLLDKVYHGELEARAQGQMLSAVTGTAGSAGYVAIEAVSGTLHGRRGSFALMHTGTMTRGARQLVVSVVPDSGSGELTGLAGDLSIRIEGGQHFYAFDYSL
jgi:hypothetical protein